MTRYVIKRGWFNRWHVYRVKLNRFPSSQMDGSWQWIASFRSLQAAEQMLKVL